MDGPGSQYLKDNQYRAEKSRLRSAAGRDIGSIPEVTEPERRLSAELSFQRYCELYHADLFTRAWSTDHLRAIEKLESTVLNGGQYAFAMPRGSGKTTLCYVVCEWALLYAHRAFVVLIGAEATAANELLDAVRTDMENNDRLLEDFPEVIYPIRQLEGISHRCNGQTCDGVRTQMTWTSDRVVFPTVEGSKCSGATLRVAGLTGRLRGMQSKTPEGHSIRPDLVIVDDPQTDDSARSFSQNDYRERLLSGAILGLAGPGESIAAFMPCTIIRQDDMAQRILDNKRHPEWRGERSRLVYQWPTNAKLWEEYTDIWSNELLHSGDGTEATKFYAEHREEMDAGSVVAWEDRYLSSELSAIQHAWNLRLKVGEEAFNAEYQNQPFEAHQASPLTVSADEICQKVSTVKHRIVPEGYDRLTGFIDISQKCLWWSVVAFAPGFTGHVVDYGTWPEQGSRYVRLSAVKKTLQRKYRGRGLEGAIKAGLEDLVNYMCQIYLGELGGEHQIEKLLIDEGDGEHTGVVRTFCRRSKYSGALVPAKGRGVRASSRPICFGKQQKGERFGHFWKLVTNRDRTRSVHTDVNYWKTFVMRRFEVPGDDPGALELYWQTPRYHQMIADHCAAETPKEIEDLGTGNRVIEWVRSRQVDNHLFDCLVGCYVGASMLGLRLAAQEAVEPAEKQRRKVSYL